MGVGGQRQAQAALPLRNQTLILTKLHGATADPNLHIYIRGNHIRHKINEIYPEIYILHSGFCSISARCCNRNAAANKLHLP